MTIRFRDRREFQAEELELTQALAHQATLAIQLTRLGQQAKQAAILEERNRMARDIHDSLAQSLTGVVMQLNAATEFLAREPDRTQACITRAQDLAKQGLAEARRSVWLLYQSDRTACGLSDSLTRLVEQMTTGTTARISLSVDGMPYCLDATPEYESAPHCPRIAHQLASARQTSNYSSRTYLHFRAHPTAGI
ncbi:sensor histidine kinase [Microcoleus sp. herbarium12]|uniref:sensor histidine kinase n=1 Tax=Microcoleus sp. herbarium12 TaxID=3055437 RepID=UPI002FCE94CB